jgi:hypothetical protein
MKLHEKIDFRHILDMAQVNDGEIYATKGVVTLSQSQFDLLSKALDYVNELEERLEGLADIGAQVEGLLGDVRDQLGDMQTALNNAHGELERIERLSAELQGE